MKTHEQIDQRRLAMARATVARIDCDPSRAALAKARTTCRRWFQERRQPAVREWLEILQRPWAQVREVLLDESAEGRRLRQSDPFCGILSPQERWQIYRDFCETH